MCEYVLIKEREFSLSEVLKVWTAIIQEPALETSLPVLIASRQYSEEEIARTLSGVRYC